MILVIDDDKQFASALTALIEKAGNAALAVHTTGDAMKVLHDSGSEVQCVILDIMMPSGEAYSRSATADGRYTGMQVFTSIRALLPEVPVLITTVLRETHVIEWFRSQYRCQVWLKPFAYSELVKEIDKTTSLGGKKLTTRLQACPTGWDNFRDYEEICVDVLRYLFVPPLPAVLVQSRTRDQHEVRDAVLPNFGAGGFWAEIRHEFGSKNIPCEFKNYSKQIATREARQIRVRLEKPTLGRFGLLVSRQPAGEGALMEQRDAYIARTRKLFLFLDDALIIEMIQHKDSGRKPEDILQRLKTEFELNF